MENQTISNHKQPECWTRSDVENLTKALTVIIEGQNAYGKKYDLENIFNYMRLKLERKFTVDQVLFALDLYTNRNDDIPTPSAIINILDPQKPRITEAEFVEAQKWQEANGYPMFSAAKETIDEYKKQQSEGREEFKMPEEFLSLAKNAIKRIE